MADDFVDFMFLQNFLDDTNSDFVLEVATQLRLNSFIIFLLASPFFRRKSVPLIKKFAEEIVPLYSLQDFCLNFRICRSVFDIILDKIEEALVADHAGGRVDVTPAKQLLIFIWYNVNIIHIDFVIVEL